MSKREIGFLLEDLLEAGEKIKSYTAGFSKETFFGDNKTIDAVIRNLEIIGEASNRIPEEFKIENAEIPWRQLVGLRNRIIHEYFGVDLDIIWNIIQNDLQECLEWIDTINDRLK